MFKDLYCPSQVTPPTPDYNSLFTDIIHTGTTATAPAQLCGKREETLKVSEPGHIIVVVQEQLS